ncbi:peptide ABC transporter permease [Catellatospora methionotrophica]|uniref:Peptide ABC transporter permease n=1 Tax=Catellatospora methionotrophica TaxID=121620 RepID=A0A8J3LAA1_9ACTN|nr:ABC transporter permease [Catellatospora methionotrophica]GIG11994.1 peptide ABC transporter permease [Catellatospora methionotrophica]
MTVTIPDGTPPRTEPVTMSATDPRRRDQASQWRLVWWRFRKHKLAMAGAIVLATVYLLAIFADFVAPSTLDQYDTRYTYAAPQTVHVYDDGDWGFYTHPYTMQRDPDTFEEKFAVDESTKIALGFFVHGKPYEMFGFIASDIHLFGPVHAGDPFYPLGANAQGQDVLSRVLHGARISMSIGLIGVLLSLLLGLLLGGISGYYGGAVDTVIQRVIEFLTSIPTIPLWMGLAAAVPPTWSSVQTYLAITVILSLLAWTDLARQVRGRFLAMRHEDFVTASILDGAGPMRVMWRHMLPSFTSHIIASVTLAVPAMILAETTLSFLGLGLQYPAVSWGVLLQEAQNLRAITTAPWLVLAPGIAVVVAVLSFNFVGDGLRDAADPYRQ